MNPRKNDRYLVTAEGPAYGIRFTVASTSPSHGTFRATLDGSASTLEFDNDFLEECQRIDTPPTPLPTPKPMPSIPVTAKLVGVSS